MRKLSLKIVVALFTFILGVTPIATYWLIDSNSILVRKLLDELLLDKETSAKNLPTPSESFLKGTLQAEQDISKGNLKVVTLGTEMLRAIEYRKILKNEYGIEVHNLGCVIFDEQREFANGYNQVSEVAIEKRYGEGVLKNGSQRADEEVARFFEYSDNNKEELEKRFPPKK